VTIETFFFCFFDCKYIQQKVLNHLEFVKNSVKLTFTKKWTMSDKFLGGSSSNLTNGTANLYIANLTIDNLDASLPVKTNSQKTLVTQKLDIADVNNLQSELDGKISNPLDANLDFQGYAGVDINDLEFNKVAPVGASTAGTLRLYANNVDSEIHMVDEAGVDTVIGGTTFDQDLNTTDDVKFNSVDTPLINTAGNLIFKSGTGAFGMGDAGGSNAGLIIQTDNAGQPDLCDAIVLH
jgi:hypothetical protein